MNKGSVYEFNLSYITTYNNLATNTELIGHLHIIRENIIKYAEIVMDFLKACGDVNELLNNYIDAAKYVLFKI